MRSYERLETDSQHSPPRPRNLGTRPSAHGAPTAWRAGALAALIGVSALAGCKKAPQLGREGQRLHSGSGPATSSSGGFAWLSPNAAGDAGVDVKAACDHFDKVPVPAKDLPMAGVRPPLASCDSEAFYYGIGAPRDVGKARTCAYKELNRPDAPAIGGAAVLMMIYANGEGVRTDLDLALKFACKVQGDLSERAFRVERLLAARAEGKPLVGFDICDGVTSGVMVGACAAHDERTADLRLSARRHLASSGLPLSQLGTLDVAAKAFFDAHVDSEVDTSAATGPAEAGTMRLDARRSLEAAHIVMLEDLKNRVSPVPDKAAVVEKELETTYGHVLACKKAGAGEPSREGAIPEEGIRKTERLWLAYRDAWLALVRQARPDADREHWKARLTKQRRDMLARLANGCTNESRDR